MNLRDIYTLYKIAKSVSDLAWLTGFRIGKKTKKK